MERSACPLICLMILLSSALIGASLAEILLYDESTGFWQVLEDYDPSTGEMITLQFVLHSKRTHELLSPDMERQDIKALYIRLLDKNVDVFIAWNKDLGETGHIAYKFNDEEEEQSIWYRSLSRESLFFPRLEEDPKEFVSRLLGAERFEVRFLAEDLGIGREVFDVRGLGNAMLPYLHLFGWEDLGIIIESNDEDNES